VSEEYQKLLYNHVDLIPKCVITKL
jgi:hypothetical protein